MPASVYHVATATSPDQPGVEINKAEWNSAHAVSFNAVGSEISGAFSNGGGVTFGLETNGYITASAPAAGGGLTNINVSAGTTSNNLSNFVFSNGGGVSFGLNGSTITATVATNYLTTAMASNRGSDFVQATAAFAGTNASGTIASNGISVSVGNYITTARASNDAVGLNTALTAGPLAWTVNSSGLSLNAGSAAGTTSGFTGNSISGSMTHNTAGLAISLNHPAWISTQSNQAFSAAGGSSSFQTLGFSDNAYASWTNTNGSVALTELRGSFYAVSNTTQSSSGTQNIDAVSFAGAGNVSVGVSNGSVVVSAPVGAGTGFTSAGANISMSGTLNTAGLSLSASVAAPGAAAEANWFNLAGSTSGNTTASGSTILLSGQNILLSGTNGSQINMSVPLATISQFPPIITVNAQGRDSGTTGGTGGSTQISVNMTIYPIVLPHALSFNQVNQLISCQTVAGTGSATIGYWYGLYTLNAGTRFDSLSSGVFNAVISQNSVTARTATWWYGTNSTSNSASISGNVSASFTGNRRIQLASNAGSLSAGQYFVMVGHSASTAGANIHSSASMMGNNEMLNNAVVAFGTNTNGQYYSAIGGSFSTTTNTNSTGFPIIPATINTSAVQIHNLAAWAPFVGFRSNLQ